MANVPDTGTLLDVRGEHWLLTHTADFGECAILTLEGRDRSNFARKLRVIEPFEAARKAEPRRLACVPRQSAMRAALGAAAAARPAAGLWTAAAAQIELLPYQLEPALAVIGGATRVLLADAVGLGKTIQAALLLSELRERGWIERALIVCPAGLRGAWAHELESRFGIRAAIFDQPSLAERIATLPPGVNPWLGESIVIASMDFVKRAEVQLALSAVPIDLLLVDEAHHLAPGTDRGTALSRLASRTPWCVLLSATPHSGDAAAFNYLSDVGSTGERLTIFRRSRADAGLASRRREHVLHVEPTPEERAMLSAIDDYARALWTAHARFGGAVPLIAITLARRAASSRSAIVRSLSRRLALLAGGTMPPPQLELPWGDEDNADADEGDAVLGAPGLGDAAIERDILARLLALASTCATGSKLACVGRLLSRIAEPAIIFTEYRDTLEVVAAHLASSYRVGAIHGGVPIDIRHSVVKRFNGGGLDVLVTTDTGGEGLNLHTRCRLVVDLELPWNPVRLEQRIGRVDRLGQQRVVHAIRVCHRHGIESRVLERLRSRMRRAAAAFEPPPSEQQIAASVFAESTLPDPIAAPVQSDTVPSAAAEAERVGRQRRLHDLATSRSAVWTPARRGAGRSFVSVHRITARNTAGVVLGDRVVAHRVALSRVPDRDRDWRGLLAAITRRVDEAMPTAREAGPPAVGERVSRIRSALARMAPHLHQASLFDARSDQAAAARRQQLAVLDEALTRAAQRVEAGCLRRIELIASWPERSS